MAFQGAWGRGESDSSQRSGGTGEQQGREGRSAHRFQWSVLAPQAPGAKVGLAEWAGEIPGYAL